MNAEEQQMFLAIEASKEAEELRQAIEASKEAEILRQAMEASKEAEELRQAIKASKKVTKEIPIIRKIFLEYTRPTSKYEEDELEQIRKDNLSDSSQGIIIGKISNKAFLVCNYDNTVSVVPCFEIEEINGEKRSDLIPSEGDSVVWKKKYITDSGGGGPVFQYPHGNFWRSTPYGYRWTDSNEIEQSRLYLS